MAVASNESTSQDDPQTTYIARGRALAGFPVGGWGSKFYDFDEIAVAPLGLSVSTSGGAASPASPVGTKSVCRLDTTAVAGGNSQLFTTSRMAGDMAVDSWYMASRQAFPIVAALANAKCGVGAANVLQARGVSMGVYGPLNATNFVVQYGQLWQTAALNLGVAIDANFHIFESWHPGDGRIYGRIDGGATVSAAFGTSPVDMSVFINSYNNGAAFQFQLDVDWALYIHPRG